jgi:hypothetical protein
MPEIRNAGEWNAGIEVPPVSMRHNATRRATLRADLSRPNRGRAGTDTT